MTIAKPLFKKVVIIGVGVIGGSLGMALISRKLAERVIGVDVDRGNLQLAIEANAVHEGMTKLDEAVPGANLVVIATPVGTTLDIIKNVGQLTAQGCIVSDVGSTKGKIVYEAEKLLPQGIHFIGGHPMTGSELAGVRGADTYLFENAVYVLTPTENTDKDSIDKFRVMIEAIGAKIIERDPDEHDLMVAAVSHLPHLAATSLVNTVGEIEKEHEGLLMLAAGGFRDTTRIASGHPLMWRDICITNKDNILKVLDRYMAALADVRALIENCDDAGLKNDFEQARELRNNIPSRMRGYLPLVHEIIVTVPDKPGVIGNLAGILGSRDININDIEILRVREGEGGTIRIALGSPKQQEDAIGLLRENGITAKKR
ncbi:MAG TPA: prephenate dehydrogenase [Desulfobacteria bacterium]|nr:prephenate dehydrogenase [Desulfobacteria bacterium]